MTATAATIRPGTDRDAARAGALHATQISGGFLSFLGPRFLARLYRRIVWWPSAFLIVSDLDGRVVGFIAGTDDVGGLYRAFVRHDGLAASTVAAPRLAIGWRRVLETLRHSRSGEDGRGRGVELLAVAVDPDLQGHGTGGRLVDAFLDQVRSDGHDAAYVVVEASNVPAIALYRRAGFAPGDEFELHAGTTSLVMQWDRPPADDGTGV